MPEVGETHSAADAPQEPPSGADSSLRKRWAGAGLWKGLRRIVAILVILAAIITVSLLSATIWPWHPFVAKTEPGPSEEQVAASSRELDSALAQHFFIALPISRCFDADITKTNVPSTVMATLMLGLRPHGNHEWRQRGKIEHGDPEPSLNLTSFQSTTLVLSDAISRARMRFADNAALNKSRMEVFQWVLVVLGALTTILISLKSIMTERSPGFFWIGVLAVVFSALSTACASLISFYTPNDSFVRSDRSLTQLRQLHTDLGLLVAGVSDICVANVPETDQSRKSLKDLSVRLSEIVSVSTGSPGQGTSGSSAQGTGPRN